jgi:hypothetical protein
MSLFSLQYESVEEIQNLFKKGLETLRLQVACFDMSSILIKPVQRILKYPLILNELIKVRIKILLILHFDNIHVLNFLNSW